MFEDIEVSAIYKDGVFTCVLPEFEEPRKIILKFSYNNKFHYNDTEVLTIFEEPALKSLIPNKGPVDGNTRVRIIGDKFINTNLIVCAFGNSAEVKGIFVNTKEIICQTPEARQRTNFSVIVSISLNGLEYSDHPENFFYYSLCKNGCSGRGKCKT
jgi:hypothetical protein